ncbi:MAG: DUF599 domain-containing protein [Confluentimicrobium sp.]|jgi:uncharacterized membrane protein|uniref:Putative membrane protein n=1 Tax=Actibacterium naphthalenivorans TaxID=1614693 RepID=A0A840CIG8_9RHOB|nr:MULTISPECIES: DUF599 domain-containing protein [Actibacterium]ALG91197.1 membrane protein [Actibacterium sp. EMB200-NS6]KGB81318.1 membrane protein [Rhodovulum sp. NI22]MBB4022566.1 putative membrane protein [Actibacterium naphthalenivorans]MBC58187.1 DUF599 domain-containing protein [Actibacterium sp.]
MDLLSHISLFGALDAIALLFWVAAWVGIGFAIERPPASRPSVSVLMTQYRRDWMQEMVTRQPRLFDSSILASLRQGTTFFASASMISIGGGLALIGNTERLLGLAEDLTLETAPAVVWEVKILAVLLLVANAFLKFVWSHRLFGYCAVVMAAVPNDPEHPDARRRARQAAGVNIYAARSFNRGMRSIYFALGGLAWLLGAVPLMVAAAVTLLVLWRREFASDSRLALLDRTPM